MTPWQTPTAVKPTPCRAKLRDITTRLKVNVTKVKKITQAEGRGGVDSAPPAKNASGKDGKGTASGKGRKGMTSGKDGKGTTAEEGGGEEQGGSWKDAGGILGDVKEGINVNLKDVKVPEFDVRYGVFGTGGGFGSLLLRCFSCITWCGPR